MSAPLFLLFLIHTIIFAGCLSFASPKSAWKELVQSDLKFIHKVIKVSHPGPIDSYNPKFNDWLETGLSEALNMSKRANNIESYRFIISKYIEGFNDGHLNFWTNYEKSTYNWPGFIVAYRNGKYVVYKSVVSQVAKGDQVISCDQKDLLSLYQSNVYPFKGIPEPKSKLYKLAPYLFIDQGNPFITLPSRCQFLRNGKIFDSDLIYTQQNQKKLMTHISEATFGPKGSFQFVKLGLNNYWLSLPTFGPDDKQLILIKKYIEKLKSIAKTNGTIVFDVRGNSGGSSSWGDLIIESLYGKENLKKVKKNIHGNITIEWRVSQRNFSAVSMWTELFTKRFGANSERTLWTKKFINEFKIALERNKKFLRQNPEKIPTPRSPLKVQLNNSFKGNIYLLTDGRCGSACLDFADAILALPNSTHVGLETSADTVYMEGNIIDALPSGLGSLYYPMKVWRNRIRGNRESYVPKHLWNGEISNTTELKNWIFNSLDKITK